MNNWMNMSKIAWQWSNMWSTDGKVVNTRLTNPNDTVLIHTTKCCDWLLANETVPEPMGEFSGLEKP
jgi:hypothetical protein